MKEKMPSLTCNFVERSKDPGSRKMARPRPTEETTIPPPRCAMRLSIHANDTRHLFYRLAVYFKWDDLSDDVVMDVGLGPERNCCTKLMLQFPEVKRVISIDKHLPNVYRARARSPHPRVEYHVADIWDSLALEQWYGTIDKMVSVNSFNCVYDQLLAFQNAFHLLKPGGEAGIHFNLSSGYFDWFQDLSQNPKWTTYYDGTSQFIPPSHKRNYSAEYYKCLLIEAGFEVILCEEKEFTYSYASDEAIKTSAAQACIFNIQIPDEMWEDFKNDAFEAFLRYNRRDNEGRPCLVYNACTALIRKPK